MVPGQARDGEGRAAVVAPAVFVVATEKELSGVAQDSGMAGADKPAGDKPAGDTATADPPADPVPTPTKKGGKKPGAKKPGAKPTPKKKPAAAP